MLKKHIALQEPKSSLLKISDLTVTILGATGAVGKSIAFLMADNPRFNQVKAIQIIGGRNPASTIALTWDLNDAASANQANPGLFVAGGTPSEAFGDILIICNGTSLPKNRTEIMRRSDLIENNRPIFDQITNEILRIPNYSRRLVMVISNPHEMAVEYFTPLAIDTDHWTQIVGMGAYLDSMRYTRMLRYLFNTNNIKGMVGGQHGENMVQFLSRIQINGITPDHDQLATIIASNSPSKTTPELLFQLLLENKIKEAYNQLATLPALKQVMTAPLLTSWDSGTERSTATAAVRLLDLILTSEKKEVPLHALYKGIPIGLPAVVGNGMVIKPALDTTLDHNDFQNLTEAWQKIAKELGHH